ncbi:hypothetical protein [Nitrospirillum amazonense]|uniref:hypothetical protein n=1 Tax=Nitrospirillum amazonense TaxID=28077 RepID=UPI001FEA4C34|nr:hypothetical protein [Nitrospirillum amazonense]
MNITTAGASVPSTTLEKVFDVFGASAAAAAPITNMVAATATPPNKCWKAMDPSPFLKLNR